MTENPTYNLTAMSKDEILQNQHSVMLTFRISLPEEDIDFPKLYRIPKLHKNLYKQRYIAVGGPNRRRTIKQWSIAIINDWVDN